MSTSSLFLCLSVTFFSQQDQEEQSFFAVFDGHGGVDAAIYASIHLHVNLARQEIFQHDPAEALCRAFRLTDERFVQKAAREVCDQHLKKPRTECVQEGCLSLVYDFCPTWKAICYHCSAWINISLSEVVTRRCCHACDGLVQWDNEMGCQCNLSTVFITKWFWATLLGFGLYYLFGKAIQSPTVLFLTYSS